MYTYKVVISLISIKGFFYNELFRLNVFKYI